MIKLIWKKEVQSALSLWCFEDLKISKEVAECQSLFFQGFLTAKNYTYAIVGTDDIDKANALLYDTYHPDEPLNKVINHCQATGTGTGTWDWESKIENRESKQSQC